MLNAVTYSVLVFQDLMEYRPFFLFNAFVHTEFKFNYLMQKYLQSCRKDTNTLHINKHLCSFFLVKVPLARLKKLCFGESRFATVKAHGVCG